MKKLLSALFILGSVAALATGEVADHPGGGGQPGNDHGDGTQCYTSACKVEKDMTISVKIPTKLEIKSLGNIVLGPWCGTKQIEGESNYTLKGEGGAKVKLYFAHDTVEFKDGKNGLNFHANMTVDGQTVSKKFLTASGDGNGKVKAKVNPLGNNVKHLAAGGTYTATAKLIAEYDSF